ncbi:hypothetical protein BPMI_00760 [Candidatus Burkholderia pumila]|uniref:PIN domain-containing protein n=1 Tax=Candidatus Burkholderia pumila TaxID=1090375 RepID=A0ABR5HL44_9BURK|nr:hypothetical protein BPMI_00760 [Candidatus Burkholderia pumila]
MENSAAPASPSTPVLTPPLRVVLDSNVWIDILVFEDPATRPIHAALEALINARCLAELTRVLDYPQFAKFGIAKRPRLSPSRTCSRCRCARTKV